MTPERITELALASGFKLKTQPDGTEALNPYVFDFVSRLLAERDLEPKRRLHKASRDAAVETLLALDYNYFGAAQWQPPACSATQNIGERIDSTPPTPVPVVLYPST